MARKFISMDGNTAAAHVAYAFTEVAAIFPITPSSVMAELADEWSAKGRTNIFGQTVQVTEMQSEAGAAGAVHGSLAAGALTTTFTASQGLLLMVPNMYKMAGELLPSVIHVSARALAAQALSIFGDHQDVMACRQTGYAMLAATNPQEVMDLGAVAHLAAIKGRVPFLHFFDGFRTSHEIQKVAAWDYADLESMLDTEALEEFRKNALNPEHPVLRGTAQNPDIYFQAREASNPFYNALPAIVEDYMKKVNKLCGTKYQLFNYYGHKDAEHVIIAMGSVCDTAEEVIDYMLEKGEKVGLLKVRLYRPFSAKHFLAALPKTVKKIAVLDRTKESGSLGEPLYLDIVTALAENGKSDIEVVGGRYGLGSKDVNPACIFAVYDNLAAKTSKNKFTVGINDDVTKTSLKIKAAPDTAPEGTISCKFWGLGADGTVGANKNTIKIIGDYTEQKVQAYFAYDSKKSGGVTVSHLRFGKKPIKSTYFIDKADFVACHNPSYLAKYDMTGDLKAGGVFLLNCPWSKDEIDAYLPNNVKVDLAKKNCAFYIMDATALAREIGMGGRINTILQASFFKLSKVMPLDKAVEKMKDAVVKSYGSKGEKVVSMNHAAIDAGLNGAVKVEVPKDWAKLPVTVESVTVKGDRADLVEFVEKILIPAVAQKGDSLPVSVFTGREDGHFPQGSAAYEKRGIAVDVPEWQADKCIQCNQCSYVCPHAAIRPFVLNPEEAKNAPKGMKMKQMVGKGFEDSQFAMAVTPLDCTGCGNCAAICPAKEKALIMKPIAEQMAEQDIFAYALTISDKTGLPSETTVKGSQFKQPLLEFSGACAGCGETPYAKLITQLYGDRMYIANATGCSSIWGGSAPSTPYTVNKKGQGPAWANSLFEDNAEYGYGMYLAMTKRREKLAMDVEALANNCPECKPVCDAWLAAKSDSAASKTAGDALVAQVSKCSCWDKDLKKKVLDNADLLTKKSMWIFGGDGWAYDIGFGGLDHVIASGEDVNIFVFDTEVYSNTGGQSSKSTPTGSVAQFAAAGKTMKKKDLPGIAMSYGYVYVASICMGADYNQTIKAITEAESYKGPSIVIAYAPCINHGIKGGMGGAQAESKAAVESGYWFNYRFDPRLKAEGKNPFTMDSKEPTGDYISFLKKEVRYTSLELSFPARADHLFKLAASDAKDKYAQLLKTVELHNPTK